MRIVQGYLYKLSTTNIHIHTHKNLEPNPTYWN